MSEKLSPAIDLFALGCHVWRTLVDQQLTATPVGSELRYGLQCYVGVTMGSSGRSLLLGVEAEAAAAVAAAMFDMPRANLRSADILDALGEAANMLAGSIGQLSGAGDELGLPEHLFLPYMETYTNQADILDEIGAMAEGQRVYIAIAQDREHIPGRE